MVPTEYFPDFARFREIVRQQFLILHLDEERAIEALSKLAASAEDRRLALEILHRMRGLRQPEVSEEQKLRFSQVEKLLAPPAARTTRRESVAPVKESRRRLTNSVSSRMKSVAVLASLGLALLLTGGASPPSPDIRPVRTIVASPHAEGESVSLTGHIRARTEESLAFRIDGRMITRRIDVGAIVKPGDLVAELDPQPKEDALRSAQAALAAAQAALHEAANNLDRQRTLVGQGWSTRVQYDATEKTFLSAQSAVASAAAQLHSAEDQLGYTKLLADSEGAVIATGAEAGEVVRAGQMIVTVAHGDGADAVFDVPAILFRQVSPDALISISLTDDPTVHTVGHVRETAPQADPVTNSYRVKVGLSDWPPAMRLGATVTGQTRMVAPGGIELPATALTTADNKPAVWVVDRTTQLVSLRPVELQRQDSSSIIVTRGLEGGEVVVTAGVHALRPGQKVRLAEDKP